MKIFMMGCWNKNACLDQKELDGREEVLNMLANEPPEYDMGILLGDNIYPFKTKIKTKKKTTKKKSFLRESEDYYSHIIQISEEITKESSNKKLHVILGNHDVEKPCVLQNQIRTFSQSPISKIYKRNTILETELAVFLMLDTNNIGNIIEFLQRFDIEKMRNRWLILCGHDPIFSFKPKKKRIFQKIDEVEMLFRVISELQYQKMAYFCADTHNFQILDIAYYGETGEFYFPVIVAGTGGANPDSLDDIELYETHHDEDTDLHINVLSSKDPFGFLELNISEKQIDIKYRKCGSTNQAVLTFKKNKLTYTIFYDESECRKPPPRCLTQSPKTQLEIC